MSGEGDEVSQSERTQLTTTSLEATGVVISAGVVGDQTLRLEEANIQIELDTAAHRREIDRQRVARELDREKREEDEAFRDRHWERVRENCTYGIVVLLIFLGLAGSFIVAVTSTDPNLQTWAQDLTTIIAGVVGGGFAGYLIGSKK